jgi:hypothetical protein
MLTMRSLNCQVMTYHKILRSAAGGFVLAVFLSACGGQAASPSPEDATALIEQRLPTLQAQLTSYAAEVTGNAPTVNAIMTLVATGGPITPIPEAGTPTPTGIAPTGGIVAFDGGDGYKTSQEMTITMGQTVTGTLPTAIEAHNWEFQGTAGQKIVITVLGSGLTDPRVKLLDEQGFVLADDDDSLAYSNAQIVYILTATGTYTIRVDTWGGGDYSLTVQLAP